MKMKSIEGIIFDIGGTINGPSFDGVDFLRYFLKESGLTKAAKYPTETLKQAQENASNWLNDYMIENNVAPQWKMTKPQQVRYSSIILESLSINESPVHLAQAYEAKLEFAVEELGADLAEDCKYLFEKLKERGYRLAIASNRFGSPSGYFRRHKLDSFFDSVEYSLVPGYRKPSPYMLLTVAEDLEINPLKCAYVGDTVKYDVIAAKRAGMQPIITTEFQKPSDELYSDEWETISKLSDLQDIF